MAVADLVIRIVSDVDKGIRGIKDAKTEVGGLRGAMQKAQPAAKIAAASLVAAGIAAGKYASDLEQSTGAVDSVFKQHASTVQQNAQSAAQSVGLSTNAYQEMSSTIGAQLKNMGIPMDQLAGQTDDLVGIGADLAATFGGKTSDAVAALSSLMRGETDPIERYGVSIKAADIEAQKATMGLDGLTGAADKQATAQATLALLSQQTADAQGAFAREADTAAGSAQRAQAEFENAAASLGEALLPMAAGAAEALADVARWAQDNVPLLQGLAVVIGTVAAAVLTYNAVMKAIAIAQGIATVAQWAWNAAVSANPIGLIILAIAALIAIIVALVMNWDTVKAVAIACWDAILAAVQGFWDWFVGIVEGHVEWVSDKWNTFVEVNQKIWDMIVGIVEGHVETVRGLIDSVVSWFSTTWNKITTTNDKVWQAVKTAVQTAVNSVKSFIEGIQAKVDQVASAIRNGLGAAWDSVVGTVTRFVDKVIGGLRRVIDMAQSAGRQIRDAFSGGFGGFSGFGGFNFGFAAPPSEVTAATTTALGPIGPRAVWTGSPARRSPAQVTNLTINVNGALDPRAVAGQIRDMLNSDARLRGTVPLGGVTIG